MPIDNICGRQKIDPDKAQLARELRAKMTVAEQALWQALRTNKAAGLHFRRQQVIDGFIVDFYSHSAGLVIELDGGVHRQQREYDAERDRLLEAHGFLVLRIRNEEVEKDLPGVVARIAERAQQEPNPLGPPSLRGRGRTGLPPF